MALLERWTTAASNGNRFSLINVNEVVQYLQKVTQLEAVDNLLDCLCPDQHMVELSRIGPGYRTKRKYAACKPYLTSMEQTIRMRVLGYRIFEPRHLFAFWQIDPMTALTLVMHFECEKDFVLSATATNTTPGVYITKALLDDPVNALRLPNHTSNLAEEQMAFVGYFYALREEVLFDQGDGSLPTTTRI